MSAVSSSDINFKVILQIASKYIIQGLAIAMAAYYIPLMYKTSLRKPTFNEICLISITAAFTMFILDYFTDTVGLGAKLGAGFTIGQNLIKMR